MFKKLFKIAPVLMVSLLSGFQQVRAEGMDYTLYQQFLDRFVKKERIIRGVRLTVVDYRAIYNGKNSKDSPYRQVLEMLKGVDTSSLKTREEKIAFWINVYNIGAIKMIVDHYPVESIRSRKISWLKNPWGKKIIDVGDKKYSLGKIEHEILLKELKEPSAHFAIVCASVSCPDLNEKVYRPDTLKEQIKSMAQAFLANKKKGMKIDREKKEVFFSRIFKFDSDTFPDGAKDALPLIISYVGKEDAKYLASAGYSIKYFDYDWSANDISMAR